MTARKIYVDGMMSGTGLRNAVEGGYIYPEDVGLSTDLRSRLSVWLEAYKRAFMRSYDDEEEVRNLDEEGMEITRLVAEQLKGADVSYYSDANMAHMR